MLPLSFKIICCSYAQEAETTLYYLQSRYYDPELGRFINADAYASTGQGVLGNNMFAYCGNNPVKYADPTGCFRQFPYKCVPLSEEDEYYYIYDQEDASIASLSLGLGTIGDNGCAVVATYNALLDLGAHVSFDEVYLWYCDHVSLFDGFGSNGIFLPTVSKYFREHGYDTIVLISWVSEEHTEYAKMADASIMLYQVKSSSGRGGHYVAYYWTGSDFLGRNTVGNTAYFSSPWEYGTRNNRTFVYEIYVFEQKG